MKIPVLCTLIFFSAVLKGAELQELVNRLTVDLASLNNFIISNRLITIKTADGQEITVSQAFIDSSITLKNVQETLPSESVLPIDFIKTQEELKVIINSLNVIHDKSALNKHLAALTVEELCNLIKNVDYLDIRVLFDAATDLLASKLKDPTWLSTFEKNPEKIEKQWSSLPNEIQYRISGKILDKNKLLKPMFVYARKLENQYSALTMNYDGSNLILAIENNGIEIRSAKDFKLIQAVPRPKGNYYDTRAIAYLRRQEELYLISSWEAHKSFKSLIILLNLRTNKEAYQVTIDSRMISSIVLSPDSKQFATASFDGTICVLDTFKGSVIKILKIGSAAEGKSWISYSPDGKYLAAAYETNNVAVHIWDTETWNLVRTFGDAKQYADHIVRLGLDYDSDSKHIATSHIKRDLLPFESPKLEIWDAQTGNLLKIATTYAGWLKYSKNGEFLTIASYNNLIVLDSKTLERKFNLELVPELFLVTQSAHENYLIAISKPESGPSALIAIYLPYNNREIAHYLTTGLSISRSLLISLILKNKSTTLSAEYLSKIYNGMPKQIKELLEIAVKQ
jgi:WD40 repeat protein